MMTFRLFGVQIRVSYSSVLLFTIAVISSVREDMIILFLVSSLLHETGHLIPIIALCGKPERLSVSLTEVNISCDMSHLNTSQVLLISVCGVLANFSLCLLSYIFYLLFSADIFYDISAVNLCIGLFNILPIRSLDGEELLSIILSRKLSAKSVDAVITILSVIFLIPIAILGFMSLFTSVNNYSLLFVFIYLISVIIFKEMR